MLDRADVVAINKFERRGAEDALRDVGRQMVRNREAFGKSPDDMPVFGTSAATFNDDGVTALYQDLRDLLADKGLPVAEGVLAASRHQAVDAHRHDRARRRGCATSPRSARPSAATTTHDRAVCRSGPPRAAARVRARRARVAGRRPSGAGGGRRRRPPRRGPHRPARTTSPKQLAAWPVGRRVLLRRRAGRHDPRQGDPQRPDPGVAVRQQDPSGLAAPLPRPRRARRVPAPREPARLLPLHRRRLPVQARGRGPGPDVRRRGRPVPHQPPVQAALRGPARHPPVDGLRLGDALRPRPRPAPRRLRQGRHVRRLGRDARRHEGALRRLRPRLARRRRCP